MPPASRHSAPIRRAARFDPSRRYRYSLRRRWAPGPPVCFVMLNPSAADEADDDPTIRRCLGFARGWGWPALEVVNLFAWRTHEPRRLLEPDDPVGAGNDRAVRAAAARAGLVICAWGGSLQATWPLARDRARATAQSLRCAGAEPACLGVTTHGHPRHPLYLPAVARPRPFSLSD